MRVCLVTLTLIMFSPVVWAGTITVDTDKGDNDTMDNLCSLAEAMLDAFNESSAGDCSGATAAPNTIEFDMGYTIILSTTIANVSNELIVDGGMGVTIDGGTSNNSIFVLSASTSDLSINNLTLQNAVNSAVRINAATAVFSATNSIFDSNTANNGGAINGGESLVLTNVVFTNNEATNGNGGAVNFSGSNLVCTDCVFGNPLDPMSGNTASGNGGGLRIISGDTVANFSIINGIFAHNTANGNTGEDGGGAIWSDNSGNTGVIYAIVNSQFISNSAPNGAGGAILLSLGSRLGNAASLMTVPDLSLGGIYRSNFLDNTASGPTTPDGSGGAIYARGPMTVVQSSFINNSSDSSTGGGVAYNGTSSHTLTVANTTFNGNSADTDGGAISNTAASNIELINVTIDSNMANNSGGGLFNDNANAADFTVVNSIVSNNTGGNCAGDPVTNSGNNLQFNPNTGCGSTAFDSGDPVLDAPAILAGDNLFVLTQAINDTSAALNGGNNTVCADPPVFNLDARGLPTTRPDGQPNCDIGAYESGFDPAVLDLTPDAGLAFGMIQTGNSSAAMTATLSNTGGSDATNVSTMFTGDFSAMTDNCNGTTVMPGGNCTIDVVFSPAADGMQMGSLTATADGGIMDSITLTGEGFTPAALDLTPDAGLAFGMVETGMMSAAMTATLTNTGGQDTAMLTVSVGTADFTTANDNCSGNVLMPGAMCTVDVIFSPQTDGAKMDMLTAMDGVAPMDAIALTGTGFTPAALDLTPDAGLAFGMVETGMMSAAMTATLTNTGGQNTAMLTVSVGTVDFTTANDNCSGTVLMPGAMCTVDVIFIPQTDGAKMDMLTAMDGVAPMDAIAISGTGFTAGSLDLTPDAGLAFGMVETGMMSAAMTATLTNTGGQDTAMLTVSVGTADFTTANDNCSGTVLMPGAMCTVDVIFSPQTDGAKMDMLTAMDGVAPMDAIALTGTGFTPAALDLTPDAGLAFGMVETGMMSAAMTATLTNTGGQNTAMLTVSVGTVDFTTANDNCSGTVLMPGAMCTVDVIFSPQTDGARMDMLTAMDGVAPMDAIALTGTGFTPAGIDLTPDAGLAFGMVETGMTSPAMTATVTNTGAMTSGLLTLSVATADYIISNDGCTGTTLMAGAQCTADIAFNPQNDGASMDNLIVTDAAGPMDAIMLSGTGFTPGALDLTPDAGLNFGSVQTGTTSTAMTATLTNTGGVTTGMITLMSSNGAYTLSNDTCSGAMLMAGAQCTTDVIFSPTVDGALAAQLTAMDGVAPSDAITLDGTGVPPLSLAPGGGLDFGNVVVFNDSATMTATLTNNTGSAINGLVDSISGDFSRVGGSCGNSLAAGASCSIDVRFTPTMTGASNGMLDVAGGGGEMIAITLTGFGIAASAVSVPTLGLPMMLLLSLLLVWVAQAKIRQQDRISTRR